MSFYSCGGPEATHSAPVSGTGRRRVIDVHCHMAVAAAAELVQPHMKPGIDINARHISALSARINKEQAPTLKPRLGSAEAKLADMDRMGVDLQILSPAPPQYYYWAEPDLGLASARLINDTIAATVEAHPDRFAGLGTVPMQQPELAVREMRRAVKELGLRGIEISTNVDGADLSEDRFAPVFAAAEELGIVIFMHPLGFSHGERLAEHYLNNVIGNPLESAIALSHLIFGGVLDRHPALKLLVAHGGGYLPTYSGRMDHAFHARADCQGCRHAPSTYLKRMSFDTVVFDPDQLAYLVRTFGADRVLMGTDHPFDMGEEDPIGLIKRAGLSASDEVAILGLNAERLFQLDPAAADAV